MSTRLECRQAFAGTASGGSATHPRARTHATAAAYAVALVAGSLLAGLTSFAAGQGPETGNCLQPLPQAKTSIDDGMATNPVMSRDGCWLFAMTNQRPGNAVAGVMVFQRTGGTYSKVRTVPAPFTTPLSGMVLTNISVC
jgi:hypothetical protein